MTTEDCQRNWPVPPVFSSRNEETQRAAGTRDAAAAARILAVLGDELPGRSVAVLRARAEHPEWSWTEIGSALELSKETVAGIFRRARKATAGKERTDG